MSDLETAATASNDMLAGNVLRKSDKPVSLAATLGNAEESKDGIDNQSETRYSNLVKGMCGEDTLAGDVLAVAAGNITLSALVSKGGEVSGYYGPVDAGKGGEDNRLFAFNDRASGGGGKDVVAGDVHSTKQGNIGLTVDVGRGGRGSYLEEGGPAGSGNAAIVFNDRLFGGSGDDILSGDVYRETAIGPISLVVTAGPGADGGWRQFCADGGAKNSARSFNDRLIGDDGDDTLVGDVFGMIDSGVITLSAAAGGGGGGYTNGNGGVGNRVFTFNDTVNGGDGEDALVGDVYRLYSHDRLELAANAGNGGHAGYGHAAGGIGGAGGDTNVVRAGNDVLRGGADADGLVGDVAHVSSSGAVLLTVGAGSGADGGQGSGGKGGGSNNVDAFNDSLFGGFGADILAGDVRSNDDAGGIALRATAGTGGYGGHGGYLYGGKGGNNNHVSAFADTLHGDAGADKLAGDVYADGTSGSIEIAAVAGAGGGGSEKGGLGGAKNTVTAFNDDLNGGLGDDVLAGDLSVIRADQSTISLTVRSGSDSYSSVKNGGLNNTVSAFNDVLAGGDGNDTLVGDLHYLDRPGMDQLQFTLEGGPDDTIRAFQDSLDGGNGKDALYGDFFGIEGSWVPFIYFGNLSGKNALFSDTLNGGGGADVIAGGIGADVMTGGAGADRFVWYSHDLRDAPPKTVDTIRDFSVEDILDLRPFFAGFNVSPDSKYLDLHREGDSTVLGFNTNGGPEYEDFVRLQGFTTDLTEQELIDHGNLLIA